MDDEEFTCPICGGEPDVLYVDKLGNIVGCECCLREKYYYELGGWDE